MRASTFEVGTLEFRGFEVALCVAVGELHAELVDVGTAAGRSWRAAGCWPRSGLFLSGVTPFREHCTSWETV